MRGPRREAEVPHVRNGNIETITGYVYSGFTNIAVLSSVAKVAEAFISFLAVATHRV